MHTKTALQLLQVVLLFTFLSASYAQDSSKSKMRIPANVKVSPAKINSTFKQQQPVSGSSSINLDKSLRGQYQFIMSKAYSYQQQPIATFYKSVQDSLQNQHKSISLLQSKLAEQSKNVATLQTEANSKEESLNASNALVNNISFLGMPIAKSTYNTIMWGLVIILGAVAATVIFLSGSARREAHYRTKLYNDLEEEYKGYKTKANDKEKKLSRDLQTVRNKLEEITGNPEY